MGGDFDAATLDLGKLDAKLLYLVGVPARGAAAIQDSLRDFRSGERSC